MSVRTRLVAERRWRILDFIAQMPARSLNEDILAVCFNEIGFPVDMQELSDDLHFLERHRCLKIDNYTLNFGRALTVATLTREGEQVWKCERHISGILNRKPL